MKSNSRGARGERVSQEVLAKRWNIYIETAKDTLAASTQMKSKTIFSSCDKVLSYRTFNITVKTI